MDVLFWFLMLMAFGIAAIGFLLGRLYEHMHGFNAKRLERRGYR